MKRIMLTYVVVPVAFWVGLFLIGIVFGGFPDTPLRQVVMIAMLIGYCFALWFWLRRKLAQVEDSSNTEETVVLKTPSQSAKSYGARTQREDRSPANHERQDAIFRFFLFG